jgi:hypothetical protein
MKGIVFTEFLDMVENVFSADMVAEIIAETRPKSGGAYLAKGHYHHREMVDMVIALSRVTEQPVESLLYAFGQYLFGRFATLCPVYFEDAEDPLDFLQRIEDVILVNVEESHHDAEQVRFAFTRPDEGTLELEYMSPRGMGDLAHGLIDGCIAHFEQPVTVARRELANGTEEFVIRR